MKTHRFLPTLMASLLGPVLWAQEPAKPEAIQDNSFLVEEAYNQEPGIVQHISTYQRFNQSKD